MKRVEWKVGPETVRGRIHDPPGKASRAPLVILMHGLASSQVEFYDFPEKIAKEGYAVLTLDYRGHGESTGQRGVISKERVMEDVVAGIETVRNEPHVDADHVALVGHSTGGGLAVCAAPHVPGVQCVVALAPIARLRDEMNPFEFVGYNIMRAINFPVRALYRPGLYVPYKIDYNRLYATSEAVERARRDAFLQPTLPVRIYRDMVRNFDAVACARNLQLPTLVMVAEYDIVVGKHNSRRVYDALRGPKKWVEVPQSGHSMCGDQRSDLVAARVVEFLQERIPGDSA